MDDDGRLDAAKVAALKGLGVEMEITGDVLTFKFRNGASEDWLAVSPMMLELDAWRSYESIEFGGRVWVKCQDGIA